MTGDLPGAADAFQIALSLARRRGDRYLEAIYLGNLMLMHIFAGRWEETIRLATTGWRTRTGRMPPTCTTGWCSSSPSAASRPP